MPFSSRDRGAVIAGWMVAILLISMAIGVVVYLAKHLSWQ
jgi:uncharacterized membrane protein